MKRRTFLNNAVLSALAASSVGFISSEHDQYVDGSEPASDNIGLSSMNITPELRAFFIQQNFRFMTRVPRIAGQRQRLPTLYFQDAAGNIGRIRQEHPREGPALVYASAAINPQRVFLSDTLVAEFINNPQNIPALVGQGQALPVLRTTVFEFYGVWDANENHYENQHGSSGYIVKVGGIMPNFDIDAYAGVVTIW